MPERRVHFGGMAVAAAATLVAVWLAASPPPLAQPPDASRDEAARFVARLRRDEPGMRRKALEKFPADAWSQGDHFGSAERRALRDEAQRAGVSVGSLIRAVDDDVHAHPLTLDGAPRGLVAPCMPRPFYE